MIRHIPNAITLGNLLSGMLGLFVCLVGEDLFAASMCMLLAALLDVLDGAVARILNVSSPLGKDLDSLADAVTFGVLPSFMMIMALRQHGYLFEWWTALPACLAVCAVLRLAKFNNDPSQAKYFSGLPSPAAGLTMIGPAIQVANEVPGDVHLFTEPLAILLASGLVAGLMVSPLKLISFKLAIRGTLPYWIGILTISVVSIPFAQGACTLLGTGAYVVASQVYFKLNPTAVTST
jgi:CDP-diacylglycerol--serine O-phosphatidyltransferase